MLLKDKRCIVSGLGPGLGKEIAVPFAREGADVALGARTESYLEEVQGEIEAMGRTRGARAHRHHRSDANATRSPGPASTRSAASTCVVHNAFAPDVFQLFEDVDLDGVAARRWTSTSSGVSSSRSRSIPHMKEQGSGSIVFVNSMIMRKVLPLQGGYATSKGALMTAAQVLAKELGPHKIRVNSIVPGVDVGAVGRGLLRDDGVADGQGRRKSSYAEIAAEHRARVRSRPTTTAPMPRCSSRPTCRRWSRARRST